MYWNNDLIEVTWPCVRDPIIESFHNGCHSLFFNPKTELHNVSTNQRLQDLCNWANGHLSEGTDVFVADNKNHYDIANLVKLNIWINDIKKQGIVKPFLMLDQGDGSYLAGNGDSRLRCLECIPEIDHVPAFISTTKHREYLYQHLEKIQTFDRFAALCDAQAQQQFLFRLTDPQAPYGIYWYEYNSHRTAAVTPGQSWCVNVFANYARQHTNLSITKSWFDQLQDWQTFAD